jgi:hypothetical protein
MSFLKLRSAKSIEVGVGLWEGVVVERREA